MTEWCTTRSMAAAVVPVDTAEQSNGPAMSLPMPPETPHHISATVVLEQVKANQRSPKSSCDCGTLCNAHKGH